MKLAFAGLLLLPQMLVAGLERHPALGRSDGRRRAFLRLRRREADGQRWRRGVDEDRGEEGAKDPEQASEYIEQLKKDKRYKRDVY